MGNEDIAEVVKVAALSFLQKYGDEIVAGTLKIDINNNKLDDRKLEFYNFYRAFKQYATNAWLIKLLQLNGKALYRWNQLLLQAESKLNTGQILRTSSLAKSFVVKQIMDLGFLSSNRAEDFIARFGKAHSFKELLGSDALPNVLKMYYQEILIPGLIEDESIVVGDLIGVAKHMCFNIIGTIAHQCAPEEQSVQAAIKLKSMCDLLKTDTQFAEGLFASEQQPHEPPIEFAESTKAETDSKIKELSHRIKEEVNKLSFISQAELTLNRLRSALKQGDVSSSQSIATPQEQTSAPKDSSSSSASDIKVRRRTNRAASTLNMSQTEMLALHQQVSIIDTLKEKVRRKLNDATAYITEITKIVKLDELPGTQEVKAFTELYKKKLAELSEKEAAFAVVQSIFTDMISSTQAITTQLDVAQKESYHVLVEQLAKIISDFLIKDNILVNVLSFFVKDKSSNFKNEIFNKLTTALKQPNGIDCINFLSQVVSEIKKKAGQPEAQLHDHAVDVMDELTMNIFPDLRRENALTPLTPDKVIGVVMSAFATNKENYQKLRKAQVSFYASRLLHEVFVDVSNTLVNVYSEQQEKHALHMRQSEKVDVTMAPTPLKDPSRVSQLITRFSTTTFGLGQPLGSQSPNENPDLADPKADAYNP